jgi:serine O-acetyltransferase
MGITNYLIYKRTIPVFGKAIQFILKVVYNIEIPEQVKIGRNVRFIHSSTGLIVHPDTIIEDDVQIYHQVTIGRADSYVKRDNSKMDSVLIKKGAVLCAGSKILCKEGILIVGENSVVGANAVLTKTIGNNEIWAGVPAKKISNRDA